MPAPERTHLYQAIVLWPFAGYDAYGDPKIGAAVEIRGRWNDIESRALDSQGNTISLDATAVVNQKITVGSRMWLGALADLPGTGTVPETDWHEVKSSNATPDIRNRATSYTLGLMKFRDPEGGS